MIDAEVKHRTQLLADVERSLSEATASRSAALSTNLIAELGPPQVTDNPIGPSGSMVTIGSTMAGLIFGLGSVFLIAPGPSEIRAGRRWSDYLSAGRRTSDDSRAGASQLPGDRAAGQRRRLRRSVQRTQASRRAR